MAGVRRCFRFSDAAVRRLCRTEGYTGISISRALSFIPMTISSNPLHLYTPTQYPLPLSSWMGFTTR